jgi:hypothetical protein
MRQTSTPGRNRNVINLTANDTNDKDKGNKINKHNLLPSAKRQRLNVADEEKENHGLNHNNTNKKDDAIYVPPAHMISILTAQDLQGILDAVSDRINRRHFQDVIQKELLKQYVRQMKNQRNTNMTSHETKRNDETIFKRRKTLEKVRVPDHVHEGLPRDTLPLKEEDVDAIIDVMLEMTRKIKNDTNGTILHTRCPYVGMKNNGIVLYMQSLVYLSVHDQLTEQFHIGLKPTKKQGLVYDASNPYLFLDGNEDHNLSPSELSHAEVRNRYRHLMIGPEQIPAAMPRKVTQKLDDIGPFFKDKFEFDRDLLYAIPSNATGKMRGFSIKKGQRRDILRLLLDCPSKPVLVCRSFDIGMISSSQKPLQDLVPEAWETLQNAFRNKKAVDAKKVIEDLHKALVLFMKGFSANDSSMTTTTPPPHDELLLSMPSTSSNSKTRKVRVHSLTLTKNNLRIQIFTEVLIDPSYVIPTKPNIYRVYYSVVEKEPEDGFIIKNDLSGDHQANHGNLMGIPISDVITQTFGFVNIHQNITKEEINKCVQNVFYSSYKYSSVKSPTSHTGTFNSVMGFVRLLLDGPGKPDVKAEYCDVLITNRDMADEVLRDRDLRRRITWFADVKPWPR